MISVQKYLFYLVVLLVVACKPTPKGGLTAEDQLVTTSQNTPVSITLSVLGGTDLTYQVGTPTNGTLTGTAPNLTYTPALDFVGTDKFSFGAGEGTKVSNEGVVTIEVKALPLTALNQTLQTSQNTQIEITLSVSGGPQQLVYNVGNPSNGTLSGTAPNLTYLPTLGFSGTDQFSFSVTNGFSTSSAVITIQVAAIQIIANSQSVQTEQNTPVNITLTASGGSQSTLSYQVGMPGSGTITGTPPNIVYTPAVDFIGTDVFSFSASDGVVSSDSATVTVTINAKQLSVANQTVQTTKNTALNIILSASGGNQPNVTYQVGVPTHGTLTGTAPNLSYTPPLNFVGVDSFTYSASDGVMSSNTATVSITVSEPLFPIRMVGSIPEQATISFFVNKPVNATTAVVTLRVYDADFATEGEMIINANTPIALFGASGIAANSDKFVDVVFNVPAAQWVDGQNSITFRHIASAGFIIDGMSVSFQ